MAHDVHKVDILEPLVCLCRKNSKLVGGQSQPVHARVDVNGSIELAGMPSRRLRPSFNLSERIQDGCQIVSDQRFACTGGATIQYEDSYIGQRVPKRYAFAEPRHKKRVTSRFVQCLRNWNRSKPVPIGFHDRSDFRAGQPSAGAVVLDDGVEANLEAGETLTWFYRSGRMRFQLLTHLF